MDIGQASGSGSSAWMWLLYGVIFSQVVFLIVAGAITGFQTGNWRPLGAGLGNTIFGADQNIKSDVAELTGAAQGVGGSDKYTLRYSVLLHDDIIRQLMLLVAVVFLGYKLFNKLLGGDAKDNFMKPVLAVFMAIGVIGVIEFVYVLSTGGGATVPFSGIFSLIVHFKEVFIFPDFNVQAVTV